MFNLDHIINEHNKEHYLKRPYIPDYWYRMLTIGGCGWGKTNPLLNLIKEQDSSNLIDKIYLYAKILMNQNISFWLKNVKI